ncbi:hypothetical protein HQQ81_21300 [Microbacteriaceae bacterium VKM Ac-2854]|nr:hypothetical protein [Microbacteriaceae bacterium VKM Ac-2854]
MKRWLHDHGLLLVNLFLFVLFFVGMVVNGFQVYNDDNQAHGAAPATLGEYLASGDFAESTFENWESEFLQMGSYVVLTIFLFQRGSSESKSPDEKAPEDQDPREAEPTPDRPWPVKRGGWVLTVYENSLAGFFFILFGASIILHGVGGTAAYNADQLEHGGATVSIWGYFGTAQFWFESFQNWQSEFLAVACIVGASVYLRQRGSAESKPVAEAHQATPD